MVSFSGANLVSAAALTDWMMNAIGSATATADQWCYAMNVLIVGGFTCPDPSAFGYTRGADQQTQKTDASTFLSRLRSYEAMGAQAPAITGGLTPAPAPAAGPGAATAGANAAATNSAGGMGLSPTMLLLLVAAAVLLIWSR